MANKKDYESMVGTYINGKELLEFKRSNKYRISFVFKCSCGRVSEALLQSIMSSDKCASCCQRVPKPYKRLRKYENVFNAFVTRVKHECNISYEEFFEIIKDQECHYCSCQLNMDEYSRSSGKRSTAACLDRKDNDVGYTVDNVVACCPKCNYGKGKWYTYEEWLEVGKAIRAMNSKDPLYAVFTYGEYDGELEQMTHFLSYNEISRYRGKPYWNGQRGYIFKIDEPLAYLEKLLEKQQ